MHIALLSSIGWTSILGMISRNAKMISNLQFHTVMCHIGRLVMFYKEAKQIDDYEEGYLLLLYASSSHMTATLLKSCLISLFLLRVHASYVICKVQEMVEWKL